MIYHHMNKSKVEKPSSGHTKNKKIGENSRKYRVTSAMNYAYTPHIQRNEE